MKLQIDRLNKSYGNKQVLKDITFTFESGKIYGLIGKNGVGKTTFFNCLNGDIDIDSGKFLIIDNDNERQLETDDIGYVVSTPVVPEFLTGREFLKFFIDINNLIKLIM